MVAKSLVELETLQVELREDGIAVLTVNRPERANSQTQTMFHEHTEAALALRDSGARALILRGAGEKAFCSGFDLAEVGAIQAMSVREFLFFHAVERQPCGEHRFLAGLDLHDVGAEVGEDRPGEGARPMGSDLEHTDAAQGGRLVRCHSTPLRPGSGSRRPGRTAHRGWRRPPARQAPRPRCPPRC